VNKIDNMSNRQKWVYNHLLQMHYLKHGEYPKREEPIPNIRLKSSDFIRDPIKLKRIESELKIINKRRILT
jgi:hypothetical protein